MLLIEFDPNLNQDFNLLKYRNTEDDNWYYLYIDMETLHLLIQNYGIISTLKIPTEPIHLDNPITGKKININFCGAPIEFYCGNNESFYLPIMEQNY